MPGSMYSLPSPFAEVSEMDAPHGSPPNMLEKPRQDRALMCRLGYIYLSTTTPAFPSAIALHQQQ